MITKLDAIQSLCPKAQFVAGGGGKELTIVQWHSAEITQPTEAEIDAEVIRLQAEYDSQEYARNRQAEYPTWQDQLDDIFHNGIDSWKATLQVTKDKYPK